jgi:hypothetical protein
VIIASWSAAAIIAATELILGVRSHLDGADLVVQTTVGVLFGLGVVALRVLLHSPPHLARGARPPGGVR